MSAASFWKVQLLSPYPEGRKNRSSRHRSKGWGIWQQPILSISSQKCKLEHLRTCHNTDSHLLHRIAHIFSHLVDQRARASPWLTRRRCLCRRLQRTAARRWATPAPTGTLSTSPQRGRNVTSHRAPPSKADGRHRYETHPSLAKSR